jgi:hypothetical protein
LPNLAYCEGALGIVGDDLNHALLGDAEPDWSQVSGADRGARTVASDPQLRGDRSLGLVLGARRHGGRRRAPRRQKLTSSALTFRSG